MNFLATMKGDCTINLDKTTNRIQKLALKATIASKSIKGSVRFKVFNVLNQIEYNTLLNTLNQKLMEEACSHSCALVEIGHVHYVR